MTESALNRTGTGQFLGHPTGLAVCFLTEMWERFSYYGMRALLIFYLTQHFLFTDGAAAGIYGAYISLVYITPVIGGMVADRYLGASKAVILGALLLIAGHAGMAIEGAQAIEGEAALQVIDARGLAIDQQGAVQGGDKKVMQELALGGEQGGVYGAGPRGLFHIVADQRLEIAAGVRAGDREHPPVLECYVLSVIHG